MEAKPPPSIFAYAGASVAFIVLAWAILTFTNFGSGIFFGNNKDTIDQTSLSKAQVILAQSTGSPTPTPAPPVSDPTPSATPIPAGPTDNAVFIPYPYPTALPIPTDVPSPTPYVAPANTAPTPTVLPGPMTIPTPTPSPTPIYQPTPTPFPTPNYVNNPKVYPLPSPKNQPTPSVTPMPTISFTPLPNIQQIFKIGNTATNLVASTTIVIKRPDVPTTIATTTEPADTTSHAATILIGGDIMFDRGIRQVGNRNGFDSLFASITPLFLQADIVLANLEGPITSNPSQTLISDTDFTKSFTFTFPTISAKTLAKAGVTAVSLANNHASNFGSAGLAETRKWLGQSGVKWFGDPQNTSSSTIIVSNGIRVGVIGYNDFGANFDKTLIKIRDTKSISDFVIVMPHWGNEYQATATPMIKMKARQMVIAGADAIIGSHPHVISEESWMGNVPVFYSVGNLLFDQHFSPDVEKGNLIELRLSKKENETNLDGVRIYETSTASKVKVEYNPSPVDFLP